MFVMIYIQQIWKADYSDIRDIFVAVISIYTLKYFSVIDIVQIVLKRKKEVANLLADTSSGLISNPSVKPFFKNFVNNFNL